MVDHAIEQAREILKREWEVTKHPFWHSYLEPCWARVKVRWEGIIRRRS